MRRQVRRRAGPPIRRAIFQAGGPGLDCHASGHLAHRCQQRQSAGLVGHRFIGDCRHAGFKKQGGLRRVRREVQVRKQHLALAQLAALGGLRLLDLDDQFAPREDLFSATDQFRTGRNVVAVRQADGGAGALLDDDPMAPRGRSRTLAGTRPTRYSWFLISRGTPTSMISSLIPCTDELCRPRTRLSAACSKG